MAKELQALFSVGNRLEIKRYFEREKDQLIATLSQTLKHHRGLIEKINREKK